MAVAEFDFYDEVDDDLLGTLTSTQLKIMEIRPALYELGAGRVSASRHLAAANSTLLRKGNIVRCRYPEISTDPLWGFVLKEGAFDLISLSEQGGEDLEFRGPGLLWLLSRARLPTQPYAPGQPELGSLTESPAWNWVWVNEPYGAILTRIVEEGQNEPGTPLRNITIDFDRTEDSAGNTWAVIAEEFRRPVGSNVLDVTEALAAAGDLYLYMDTDLVLHAYQSLDDFTTDRTSATFTAGKVRFEKGVNIMTALTRESKADPITHVIQRLADGDYHTEVVPGFNATTDIAHYGYNEASQTNDGDLGEKIAQQVIQSSRADAEKYTLEIQPGNSYSDGLYVWSSQPGDARFWWDLVTVHTGTGEHDLDESSQRVVACTVLVDTAAKSGSEAAVHRSLHFIPELSHRPIRSFGDIPNQINAPGSTPGCQCLKLCQPGVIGSVEFIGALGAACSNLGTNIASDYPAWSGDNEERVEVSSSEAVPAGGTVMVVVSTNKDGANAARDRVVYDERGNTYVMDDESPIVGTADWVSQIWRAADIGTAIQVGDYIRFATNVGTGTGDSESGGRCIDVSAWDGPLTDPVVGTNATGFGATPTVASTAVGDVTYVGLSAFDDGTITGDADWSDLNGSESVIASGAGNGGVLAEYLSPGDGQSWAASIDQSRDWSITSVAYSTGSSSTARDGHPDLVGTDSRVTRCDHRHDVHRSRPPNENDDESEGYKLGTIWAQLDDLDNPTEIIAVWVLADATEGAAVWLPWPGGTSGAVDADDVAIADAGTYYTGNDVEAALQEIGADLAAITGISGARFPITAIFDAGSSAISGNPEVDIIVPAAGTIVSVTMLADVSGSAVVDIWKDTYANYPPTDADSITASAVPTISSAIKSQDTTLTGWTISVSAGDILRFHVDSASTIKRLVVTLIYERS